MHNSAIEHFFTWQPFTHPILMFFLLLDKKRNDKKLRKILMIYKKNTAKF